MPNIAEFNNILFNGWSRLWGAWQITDDLIFNGLWLQNQYIITSKIDFWNMPKTNLLTYTNPKSDWWGVLDRFFKERTITIEGVILWTDATDLETRIDAIKKALAVKTWYLQMKIKGTYRRIIATLTNQDIFDRKHSDITRAPFKLTFKAMQPFRREKDWENYLFEDVNQEVNEDLYNSGSEYSEPIINMLVNSASGTNEIQVWIWSNIITFWWETTYSLQSVEYWGETCTMTAWPDNTWSGVRPSTQTPIVISLNGWVPSCVVAWNQVVELAESWVEWTWNGSTQWGVWIVVVLSITKSGTFAPWDIIEINVEKKVVEVNGVSTDFNWKFPIVNSWWNTLNIKANWTYQFDVAVLFPKNYL